jgi:hypothetical protein
MNLAETIYQKSLDLPEEKAIEVIDFIDFLKQRSSTKTVQSNASVVVHDINRHAGKITLTQDPLAFQKAMRDEWS